MRKTTETQTQEDAEMEMLGKLWHSATGTEKEEEKTMSAFGKSIVLGVVSLMVLGGSASAQELITNGNFEANGAAVNGSNATGWTKDGAYGLYNGGGNSPVHGGIRDYVTGNGFNTSVGVYQTLGAPLVAGNKYTLTFWANRWTTGSINVRVGKYNSGSRDADGSYSPLPLAVIAAPTTDPWEFFTYTFTAVGGEDTVYFGTHALDGCDIDDVSLQYVPPPATPGTLIYGK